MNSATNSNEYKTFTLIFFGCESFVKIGSMIYAHYQRNFTWPQSFVTNMKPKKTFNINISNSRSRRSHTCAGGHHHRCRQPAAESESGPFLLTSGVMFGQPSLGRGWSLDREGPGGCNLGSDPLLRPKVGTQWDSKLGGGGTPYSSPFLPIPYFF